MKASDLKRIFVLNDEDLKEIRAFVEFFNGKITKINGVNI